MGGLSRDRALWLSRHVLPHEAGLRSWLAAKRVAGIEIDDIVQESYAKLVALQSVENIQHPRSYFFQTAYSVLVTHIRRSRIVAIRSIEEIDTLILPSDDPLPDRQLEDRDQLGEIARAIASLPQTCRRVFVLRRVVGLSQRQVAEQLRLSENTVEHHMTKSIRVLMDLFGRGGKAGPRASVTLHNEKTPIRDDRAPNKQTDR